MDKLKFINEQMDILAVPYELNEWTRDVSYPYFTGEFTEDEPTTEDGYEHATLILNGFHRGKYSVLEEMKSKIKKHFHPIYGLRSQTDSGAIIVSYGGAFPVPTGEKDLKRIQINLDIKEWKGDL